VLAQPSVAVVDSVVEDHDTREVAEAYIDYLYSDVAQRIAGENYYRPTNETILEEFSDTFDLNIKLVTIDDDIFGGWDNTQTIHLSDGGIFDQIYEQ
jgi:sulfate transport system substrate-binding protein